MLLPGPSTRIPLDRHRQRDQFGGVGGVAAPIGHSCDRDERDSVVDLREESTMRAIAYVLLIIGVLACQACSDSNGSANGGGTSQRTWGHASIGFPF